MEVVSPSHCFWIPPEFAPVPGHRLDAGHLDGSHARRVDCISFCERPETSFCSTSFLHAAIVMLLKCQVGVHQNT